MKAKKSSSKLMIPIAIGSMTLAIGLGCMPENGTQASQIGAYHASLNQPGNESVNIPATILTPTGKKKIKIALLLDTSNSMDGLIDQAKSQLWKIVNELAAARCENEKPDIEIALYEYGNDRLSSREGYIKQVSMFTSDLDLISEKLFALTTNGGNEFCGHVISSSLDQLEWSTGEEDGLKLIFIAGNEPFTQGGIDYRKACGVAKEKDITVNTIFCGSFDEGISSSWKNGADLTEGSYMSIEQNRQTVYIETPYDKEIAALNGKLNATYIAYGRIGYEKMQSQAAQDNNASSYGTGNVVSRTISKSSHAYKNSSWDLVDASQEKDFEVSKLKEEDLPEELKGKTSPQKEEYIKQKNEEREKIKSQINALNKKRTVYISENSKTEGEAQSLDAAMIKAIRSQAGSKNFVFEN